MEVPNWTLKDSAITREFQFKDFRESMAFVNKVAKAAEEQQHHPDIFVAYKKVRLTLKTDTIKGLSQNDFIMAARIDLFPKNFIAEVSMVTHASVDKVWDALVNPEVVKKYMFGTNLITDWREGSPIIWKGEWQGKSYEDKGVVLQCKPQQTLQYTYFSALTGLPDIPENYHTITVTLSPQEKQTRLSLTQDGITSEEARDHSEKNWNMVLGELKKLLEQ
jgi:pterin-4a-carbinolamine dehydratase/uncharacterized protein YndB with AHSA1/START domain